MNALFAASEAWNEDPVNPGLDNPTPLEIIYSLTRSEREQRVRNLIRQAKLITAEARTLADNREITATCILFSGGNDSTVLAHLMRDQATHAVHANTGIGIEETRQFVRDMCKAWELPLLEKHPPTSYRELVIERGFPGPAMHFKMYQRLKERCLIQVRRDLVTNSRTQRVLFLAGRRRAESARRADIPLHEVQGSIIWASPIAMWTKPDMATYRLMMRNVPVNHASELIGMSGECLCGSFAKPGELEMIRSHFPQAAAQIDQLQREVTEAGWEAPLSTWGHTSRGIESSQIGRMCTSCTMTDPLIELMERNQEA